MPISYLSQVSGYAGFEVLCGCGHRRAEHTAFDTCHGCNDCGDSGDQVEGDDEHDFRRCACDGFTDVAAIDWTELIGSA